MDFSESLKRNLPVVDGNSPDVFLYIRSARNIYVNPAGAVKSVVDKLMDADDA
jgi:hypothetical protein